MTKKKRIMILGLCSVLLVLIFALLSLIINGAQIAQKNGYKQGMPEYAIASEFARMNYPDVSFRYVFDDDILFAVTTDPNIGQFVILRKNNGKFSNEMGRLVVQTDPVEINLAADVLDVRMYKNEEKFISYAAIFEYPIAKGLEKVNPKVIKDISHVKVYDSIGEEYQRLDGNCFSLFYNIRNDLPASYKLFLEYNKKQYTILDASHGN